MRIQLIALLAGAAFAQGAAAQAQRDIMYNGKWQATIVAEGGKRQVSQLLLSGFGGTWLGKVGAADGAKKPLHRREVPLHRSDQQRHQPRLHRLGLQRLTGVQGLDDRNEADGDRCIRGNDGGPGHDQVGASLITPTSRVRFRGRFRACFALWQYARLRQRRACKAAMKNVEHAGVSKAILAAGGFGVLVFPFLAATDYGDITLFCVAVPAVLAPWIPLLRGHVRGQSPALSDVLLLGFLFGQVGGGIFQALTDATGEFGAAISPADIAFLCSYLLAAAGLGVRVWEIKGPARTIGAIDAAVLLTGLLLMGGQFLLFPTLQASAGDGPVSVPSLLRVWYPMSAYILLALLVWMSAATRPHSPSLLMLRLGFTVWAIAESAFHLTAFSLSVPEWWNLVLWLSAYVLISAGIAHPDKGRLTEDESPLADELPSRAGFLAIALLSIPLSMWALTHHRNAVMLELVMLGCTLLVFLIWLRFNLLYGYLRRLGKVLRELSEIDPVSGAWNRRYFNEVMQEALTADRHPVALFVLRIEGVATDAPRSSQERLLVAAARALGRAGTSGDPVARIGEREFALIQHRPGAEEKLLGAAWRALNDLNDLLRAELPDENHRQVRGYIGIGLAPRDGANVADLLDCVCKRVDAGIGSGYRVMAANPEAFEADADTTEQTAAWLAPAPRP